jgi:hypothetical protein
LTVPRFFTTAELGVIEAACERLVPLDAAGRAPGAMAGGAARYIDHLLGAFTFDPPRIWAGGPFSGRHGGEPGFERFVPLDGLDELAWRIRIEGSLGIPDREFNGPYVGWQQHYRDGLHALGEDFATVDAAEQDRRLDESGPFKSMLYEHTCEAMYGDPVYGGNRDGIAWTFIGFGGDSQPRGFSAAEVSERDR